MDSDCVLFTEDHQKLRSQTANSVHQNQHSLLWGQGHVQGRQLANHARSHTASRQGDDLAVDRMEGHGHALGQGHIRNTGTLTGECRWSTVICNEIFGFDDLIYANKILSLSFFLTCYQAGLKLFVSNVT